MPIRIPLKFLLNASIRGGAAILGLLSQVWIVNIVGVKDYGVYATYISLISFLSVFCKGGYDICITNHIIGLQHNGRLVLLLTDLINYLGNILFWALGVIFLYYLLMQNFAIEFAVNSGLIFLGVALLAMTSVALSALRALGVFVISEVVDSLLKPIFILLAAYFLASFATAGVFNSNLVLAYLFVNIFVLIFIVSLVAHFSNARFNELFHRQKFYWVYSVRSHYSYVIYGLLSLVFFQLDTYFVGIWLGSEAVASYNMACNFVRLVIFVPLIFLVYFQPHFVKLKLTDNVDGARRVAFWALMLSLISAAFASCFLFIFGRDLLIYVHPGFGAAYEALVILSCAHMLNSVIMILSAIILLCDKKQFILRANLIGALVTVVFYFILIKSMGILGAAISVFLGLFLVLLMYIPIFNSLWRKDVFLSKVK